MCYCNTKIDNEYCKYCIVVKSKINEISKMVSYNEKLHFHLISKVFSPQEQFDAVNLQINVLKEKLKKAHVCKKLNIRILYNQIKNDEVEINLLRFEEIFNKFTLKSGRRNTFTGRLNRVFYSMNPNQRKDLILYLISPYL